MRKFDAEKSAARIDPGVRWVLFLARPGGWGVQAEFSFDFRLDFRVSFTRPAPQAGCGGSKIDQNRPQGRPGAIYSSILSCLRQHARPGPRKVGVPTVDVLG